MSIVIGIVGGLLVAAAIAVGLLKRGANDQPYLEHREALHRVLWTNEQTRQGGLPAHDIARALNLSDESTTKLLSAAIQQGAVTEEAPDGLEQPAVQESVVLYRSTSRLAPQAQTAPALPLGAIGLGAVGVVGILVAVFAGADAAKVGPATGAPEQVSPTPQNNPSERSSPTPKATEAEQRSTDKGRLERIRNASDADAARMAMKRLQKEHAQLNARIVAWKDAAVSSECETTWSAGERCYIKGRMMTRAQHQKETAALTLKAAELASLLETYRSGMTPK